MSRPMSKSSFEIMYPQSGTPKVRITCWTNQQGTAIVETFATDGTPLDRPHITTMDMLWRALGGEG